MTGEEIDDRVRIVPSLLNWACGGEAHRKRGNYMAVVEGRDWKGYSSCADLAHWLLYRLGCRQPWINRAEHKSGDMGKPGWDVAVNVGRFAFSAPNSVRRTPVPGYMIAEPGDILIVWNREDTTDSHVMVAASSGRLPGPLRVAEYGQPGGHLADKMTSARDGAVYVNGAKSSKRVQRWLPLHLVITNAAERGELAAVTLPEGFVSDTIPAPPPEPTP